jgi:hypothetical protein
MDGRDDTKGGLKISRRTPHLAVSLISPDPLSNITSLQAWLWEK